MLFIWFIQIQERSGVVVFCCRIRACGTNQKRDQDFRMIVTWLLFSSQTENPVREERRPRGRAGCLVWTCSPDSFIISSSSGSHFVSSTQSSLAYSNLKARQLPSLSYLPTHPNCPMLWLKSAALFICFIIKIYRKTTRLFFLVSLCSLLSVIIYIFRVDM